MLSTTPQQINIKPLGFLSVASMMPPSFWQLQRYQRAIVYLCFGSKSIISSVCVCVNVHVSMWVQAHNHRSLYISESSRRKGVLHTTFFLSFVFLLAPHSELIVVTPTAPYCKIKCKRHSFSFFEMKWLHVSFLFECCRYMVDTQM